MENITGGTNWIADDFDRNYEAECLPDLPHGKAALATSSDGIFVRVRTANASWWGIFGFGQPGYPLPTGLVSCPNPNFLLVIACGAAYYVDVVGRTATTIPDCRPIHSVASAVEGNCILLGDNTRVCCIGENGVSWTSAEVVFDGLDVIGVEDRRVVVRGFEPRGTNGRIDGLKMADRATGMMTRYLALDNGQLLS